MVGQVEIRHESQRVLIFSRTTRVLEIESLEEHGETLVEPEVSPVAAGDAVAEPLMREFVRGEPSHGPGRNAMVLQIAFAEGGGTDVFLRSAVVVDGRL